MPTSILKKSRSTWDESNDKAFRDFRDQYLGRNLYMERDQILDDFSTDSSIRKSPFRGIYRIGIILLYMHFIIFMIVMSVHKQKRYQRKGEILNFPALYKTLPDLVEGLLIWAFISVYSYSGLLFQKLIVRGVPLAQYLQIIFHSIPAYGLSFYIAWIKASTFWKLFVWTQIAIHYFKINSYLLVNRDLKRDNSPLYPANVNFKNFSYFMLAPTACYEPVYPMRKQFRPLYFLQKLGFSACAAVFLFIVVTDYYPEFLSTYEEHSSTVNFLNLMFTQKMLYFMFFFVFFDGMLNVWGELTKFGDRQFYQDFWNSTDFAESNRKWNHVVHQYLYRHVFAELYHNYHFSVTAAMVAVFIYSALFHELVVFYIFDMDPSYYLLFLMLYQIAGKSMNKFLKGTYLGIMVYWFGQLWGQTLFVSVYLYDMLNYKF